MEEDIVAAPVAQHDTKIVHHTCKVKLRKRAFADAVDDDLEAKAVVKKDKVIQGAGADMAPAWFAPALEAALKPIRIEIANGMAFSFNSSAIRGGCALLPLKNEEGVLPPNFPVTKEEFDSMESPRQISLLNFYGLKVLEGESVELGLLRKRALGAHIGLRP